LAHVGTGSVSSKRSFMPKTIPALSPLLIGRNP
jgi:hypothetical protein